MSPGLYRFAVALGVTLAIALGLHGIFFIALGMEFVGLQNYYMWYVGLILLSFTWSVVILKYLYHKNFRIAFQTGVVSTFVTIVHFSIITNVFVGDKTFAPFYALATILTAITSSIHFGAIIWSDANRRYWLKLGAITSLIFTVLSLLHITWSIILPIDVGKTVLIQQLLAIGGPLSMVFFILNFRDELQSSGKQFLDTPQPDERKFESGLITAGMSVIMISCVMAMPMFAEVFMKLSSKRSLATKSIEWNKSFEDRKYSTLSYRLLKPLEYDSTKKYPMVVCLPYDGSIEGCPPAQWLSDPIRRPKYRAFIYVPFCEPGAGWGGIDSYTTTDVIVFESLDSLKREFTSIDADRIYVTGVSKGGYGSWHFICSRPDMFAAAIPVCGAGDPKLASKITDVSVWAFHGALDKNVPVAGSRDMIDAIRKTGGDPRYTEFPGGYHHIWQSVESTSGLLDWLFEQRKTR